MLTSHDDTTIFLLFDTCGLGMGLGAITKVRHERR